MIVMRRWIWPGNSEIMFYVNRLVNMQAIKLHSNTKTYTTINQSELELLSTNIGDDNYVMMGIKASKLHQLLQKQQLVACDLHCHSKKVKRLIMKLLLDCLVGKGQLTRQ